MGRDVDRDEALPEREPVEAADRGRAAPQARRRESRIVGSAAARAGREVPRRRVRTAGPVPGRAARSAEVIEVATVRTNRGGRYAALHVEMVEELLDGALEWGRAAHGLARGQPSRAVRPRQDSAASSSSRACAKAA